MSTIRKYQINHLSVTQTIAKANKIAARAAKKGLIGGYTVTTTEETVQTPGGYEVKTFLVIEGEPAKKAGWAFVAAVEFIDGTPVVTGSPFYTGPQVDRSVLKPDTCQECGKKIARTKTIVVEDEAGQRLQVGTSCVKDFLGQEVTPAWYSTKDPFSEFDGYAGGGQYFTTLLTVLTEAASIIRQAGFVSRAAAEGYGPSATADLVGSILGLGRAKQELRKQFGDPTEADFQTAAAALEFGKTLAGTSDYAENVKALFNGPDAITGKYFGLAVSVVGVYVRQRAEAVAKPAEVVADAPTGTVKVTGTVLSVKWTEDYGYGPTKKLVVKDDAGFKVWVTAGKGFDLAEPGDKVEFTATVTPSDRDATFGFAKRPRGGKVLQAAA